MRCGGDPLQESSVKRKWTQHLIQQNMPPDTNKQRSTKTNKPNKSRIYETQTSITIRTIHENEERKATTQRTSFLFPVIRLSPVIHVIPVLHIILVMPILPEVAHSHSHLVSEPYNVKARPEKHRVNLLWYQDKPSWRIFKIHKFPGWKIITCLEKMNNLCKEDE